MVHFDLHANDDEIPTNVTSITIHPGVTTIRRAAFQRCINLQSLHLPHSIARIGISAFDRCSQLKSIHLPDTITDIPYGVFYGCSQLRSIHLPHSITHIATAAFANCHQLQLIALHEYVDVDILAFLSCTALEARLDNGHNYNADIATWLRQRFTELPLHQLFYRTTENSIATDALRRVIGQHTLTLTTTDAMGMTPLHVLCANKSAIPLEWLHILRAAQPDAASMRTVMGHTPLMMLLHSKGIQYDDYYNGSDRELVLLPLVGLLKSGLNYDALETILVFHEMQLVDEMGEEDEESGLLPFMYAASLMECELDVVYQLAIHHPHLLCKNFKDDDVSHVAQRRRLE